jgi:carbamoyl-phosphate synthase small subunit
MTPSRFKLNYGGKPRKKSFLILEDGSVFDGVSFGSEIDGYGEVVFTTSMTGYLESLTDPSYKNQILVFASPTVANYSIKKSRMESSGIVVSGLVTRDAHAILPGGEDWEEFNDLLSDSSVPGIDMVDTRALVRKLREKGVMRGWISSEKSLSREFPDPMAQDVVSLVSPSSNTRIKGNGDGTILYIDVGSKNSIKEEMLKFSSLIVTSPKSDLSKIGYDYSLIFISNGPGDPAHPSLEPVRRFIREMAGKKPIFGVCLGHQLIGLAMGGKTLKMKFGHRGSNHAVSDGRNILITTHNHGYALDEPSLSGTGLEIVQRDVNDLTVERIENRNLGIYSVQYHPEASPGPHDSKGFFSEIRRAMGEA